MSKKPTISKLKQKLQPLFNTYIRQRDTNEEGMGTCISCGQFKPLEAGHFYPVKGYDSLRFNEDNTHGECARCNRFDDAHLIGYSDNIPRRIGESRLEALKTRAQAYKRDGYKWTRMELEEKITHYKNLLK